MDEQTLELTRFAELRPSEPPPTAADLADLRAELFPGAARPTASPDRSGQLIDLAPRHHRSTRRRPIAAAAAAVALLGGVGLWVTATRDAGEVDEADPVAAQPVSDEPVSLNEFDVPRVAFDEPGWTLTRSYQDSWGEGRAVVFLSQDDFDGPWIDIAVDDSTDAPAEPTVDVDGLTVGVDEYDQGAMASWTTTDGTPVQARAWGVGLDELRALVPTVGVLDGVVAIDPLPAGARLAAREVADAVGSYGEYGFIHDDGRELQISFYPGAASAQYGRITGDERTAVRLGAEDASLLTYGDDSGDGRYRVNVQRYFWVWEFDGEPFGSEAEFLDTVAGVRRIDEATWQASLPDAIVGAVDVDAAVAAALADVPLPNGLDPADIAPADTLDRYQFIARLSGSVTCAWLDQWFTAVDAGDTAMQQQAADALATSRVWAMLAEIADEGAWSEVVWMYADAVNGGDGIPTGGGLEPPTRDSAAGGLDCDW